MPKSTKRGFINIAFTWIKRCRNGKPFMSLGHYTRQNAELCLLGIRGRMSVKAKNISSVIETLHSTRMEHSRKPDEQYERIERLYDGPYLELFARRHRSGWAAWGHEVEPTVTASPAIDTPGAVTRYCLGCRRVLAAARADARYCCNACRQSAYRRRTGEEASPA